MSASKIKNFFPGNKLLTRNIDYVIAGLVFSGLAYICINRGIVLSPDSDTFSTWGDILIATNFDLGEYLSNNQFVSFPGFYLTSTVMIAVFKLLSGEWWQEMFFSSNLILIKKQNN